MRGIEEDIAYIEGLIMNVPNYPREGVTFKDITPILSDGRGFCSLISLLSQPYIREVVSDLDNVIVVGLEARGFILGAALAAAWCTGFVPIRKKGKLPREVYSAEYKLEYGTDTLEIHQDALLRSKKVIIVDDVIATGGTLKAAVDLIEKAGGIIIGITSLILLEELYKTSGNEVTHQINSVLKY